MKHLRPFDPAARRANRRQRIASRAAALVWCGAMVLMLGWIIARTDLAIGLLAVAALLIHTGLWPLARRSVSW